MLTDEELMLLEQWTYLHGYLKDSDVNANVREEGMTIGEMLDSFTESDWAALEKMGPDGMDPTTGKEWSAILRKIQENEKLRELELKDYDPDAYAYQFVDSDGQVYVAFKGTSGADEWYDNTEGLATSDTECQQKALDYIEGIEGEDIVVVGHSKGGNKAMYVAITSDKVSYCLSMDGQGFSQEFLDKYAAEIAENASKIKNFSVATDYVHILMFQIPGTEQRYFQAADGFQDIPGSHSPAAFFSYRYGDPCTMKEPLLKEGEESLAMRYLHGLTCFLVNCAPEEDKERIAEYLGNILAIALGGKNGYRIIDGVIYPSNGKIKINGIEYKHGEKVVIDGVEYTVGSLTDYLLTDEEALGIVIAYIVKYIETYELSNEEIVAFLDAIGLVNNPIVMTIICTQLNKMELLHECDWVARLSEEVRQRLFAFIGSFDALDLLIAKILAFLCETFGWEADLDKLWTSYRKTYKKIGKVDPKATREGTVPTGRDFDYTLSTYNELLEIINRVEAATIANVSNWSVYASEEWYRDLLIHIAITGINGYYEHLWEINDDCKKQIEKIFDTVADVDRQSARSINEVRNRVTACDRALKRVYERMKVTC